MTLNVDNAIYEYSNLE